MKDLFEQAQNEQARKKVLEDPNALTYHLMPPAGWLNDPNGLCQFDGTYHIFYQYSPMNTSGAALKGWGHYSTPDFVHYTEEPIPLLPDDFMDENGAYSGSAFVHDGLIHFFYTGNGKDKGDFDYINEGRRHWTNHFTSKDGYHFSEKETLMKNADYPANLSCHVRDPKVIEEPDGFYMVLGARTRDSIGQVNTFFSQDLQHWKPYGVIHTEKPFGYMWECPDLFDVDGKRILITCPQGVDQDGLRYENIYQNGYFVLNPEMKPDMVVDGFEELDNGFDFYAPQSFEDEKGRRILIGWMGIPDADYGSEPNEPYGWKHALTLPRELHFKNGRLYQKPVEEIYGLRKEEQTFQLDHSCHSLPSPVFELEVMPKSDSFEITLRKDVTLSFDKGVFTLDMKTSGEKRTIRHVEVDHIEKLDIFSDTSSLEIFINDGQHALTTRIFDDHQDLQVCANSLCECHLYEMGSFVMDKR